MMKTTVNSEPRHQIERQVLLTSPKWTHVVTCTCGRQIARTTSMVTADRKAEYHLEAAE